VLDTHRLSMTARRKQLIDVVDLRGYCVVAELATMFDVSEMTIRRDISELSLQHHVVKFHGGVRSKGSLRAFMPDYAERTFSQRVVKRRIAELAIQLVEPGSTVGLDAGTTVSELAQLLPMEIELRVITASLTVAELLISKKNVEVTSLGGVLRRETLSFVGTFGVESLSRLQMDTVFLGAHGLSRRGVFDATDQDATIKRSMIRSTDRVVLLADSSKFAKKAMTQICDWSAVNVLVTDDGITDTQHEMLLQRGVDVHLAPSGGSLSETDDLDDDEEG
jgi:DeoR/GlpR family transcriptional regulator of sugar metabolism